MTTALSLGRWTAGLTQLSLLLHFTWNSIRWMVVLLLGAIGRHTPMNTDEMNGSDSTANEVIRTRKCMATWGTTIVFNIAFPKSLSAEEMTYAA